VIADPRLYPPRVRILYEDSRAATKGFGLHDFVLANTHDVIVGRGRAMEPYQLAKLIEAIPVKSDTKVLRALERDAERLHAGRTVIVAWLDDDKIHRPLGLAAGQPTSTLIQAIQRRVHPSVRADAIRIHLLRGNAEQFLRRIDGAQPNTFDATTLADALDKVPTARDLCFRQATSAGYAGWRRLVRKGDPSFDDTIGYLAEVAIQAPWPPWQSR
jgi:hypothetical protein